MESRVGYIRLRSKLHSLDVFLVEVHYISFLIEGIEFAHCLSLEDKEEIWFTSTLFRCFWVSRFSFMIVSDSLYCSNCSLRSFICFSCLWFSDVSILSFRVICCMMIKRKIKKSDYCVSFSVSSSRYCLTLS